MKSYIQNLQISRVTRTKEEGRTSYNKMSKWYDMLASPSERKYRAAGLQKLCTKEGETVLEIGTGNSSPARQIRQRRIQPDPVSGDHLIESQSPHNQVLKHKFAYGNHTPY